MSSKGEYKPRDKIVYKMGRDGLVEENRTTGEEILVGRSEKDFSTKREPLSGTDSKGEPAKPGRKRRPQQESADAPGPEVDSPSRPGGPETTGKDFPIGKRQHFEREAPAQAKVSRKQRGTKYTGKFADDGKETAHKEEPDQEDSHQERPDGKASQDQGPKTEGGNRQGYETRGKASEREQARDHGGAEQKRRRGKNLNFEDGEQPPDPPDKKLDRVQRKADRADAKLEGAREKLPTKKRVRTKLEFDEKKGKQKRQFYIEKEVKSQQEHLKGALPLRPVKAAKTSTIRYGHKKMYEVENENVGTKAAHRGELVAEDGARKAYRFHRTRPFRRVTRLEKAAQKSHVKLAYRQALHDNPQLKSNMLSRYVQKRKIKREYAKAAREAKRAASGAQKTGGVVSSAARAVTTVIRRHPRSIAMGLIIALMVLFFFTAFTSCGLMAGNGLSAVFLSSYVANDEDIDKAELYYTELETDLQLYIASLETANPGYDEYLFTVPDISHNPYELMAFLTATYGAFTFDEVKPVLDFLFAAQYGLSTDTYTETRTVTREIQVGAAIGQVRTSAYCPCAICCGPYANGITASGTTATANRTIAVDAYNPILPMGTKVVINGVQYTVEDTGNLNANNTDFDIYFDTHQEALNWGKQTHTAYLGEGNENTVEVTITETVRVLEVTLHTTNFTSLVRQLMDSDEREHYSLLMETKGNRQYVDSPFDFNWLPHVTSYYGYRVHPTSGAKSYHKGVDIGVAEGTPILATHSGTITFAGSSGDYGNIVIIDDGKGLVTKYAHCATMQVSAGDVVEQGDQIATVGSTGNSTGPHLHFEVIMNDVYLNPLYFAVTNDDGSGPIYGNAGSALGDDAYAALIAEAEKHLGKPYYMGANGPNSFDCSSYVCWVFRESGVWNISRTTAQGIYNACTPISASEAQPGDIIFFTGTYSTSDTVTHVGIYVGNGMMIHAGSPIQYTSINTSYWQNHFYSFGRAPV